MSLSSFLKNKALKSGDFDFPGFKMQVFHKGEKKADLAVGKVHTYYDVASITKIIFTTTYFMDRVGSHDLKLQTAVKSFLPWYPHARVKLYQLLNHSAGNQWWEPFYKKMDLGLPSEQKYQQLENLCRKAPLSRSPKATYSDIDFYLLGSIMQRIEQKPLLSVWQGLKEKFYPKTKFHFNVDNKSLYKKSLYGPTEKCSWRKTLVRGSVHDENAWALGGVAPHAGLFGRIEDLSFFGLFLRQTHLGQTSLLKKSALNKFSARSLPTQRGDWGYGFMLPSPKGSSAGELLSKKSFGHTGFTGTALWFDPQRDLLVSLLSNRVSPSREQKGFVRLRPKLHDWTVEYLERRMS